MCDCHHDRDRDRDRDHHQNDRQLVRRVVTTSNRAKGRPRCLDVIGYHRELTVIGHLDAVEDLPFKGPHAYHLLDEYAHQPGNLGGKSRPYGEHAAKIIDYGNNYISLKVVDDITRPEVGDILLGRGWKMVGTSTVRDEDKVYLAEKWIGPKHD